MLAEYVDVEDGNKVNVAFRRRGDNDIPVRYRVSNADNTLLVEDASTADEPFDFLPLEGELNKLAANSSIGRKMTGVHDFTDDYDSLRMGESVALGILVEQALTYPTDPFVRSVPTFDGKIRRIGRR